MTTVSFIRYLRSALVLAIGLGGLATGAHAEDVVRLFRPNALDKPVESSELVLEEALRRTQRKWGPYRIEKVVDNLVRERLLAEVESGKSIDVAIVATQQDWEARVIPVRIPIDMGLSGYRIGLIRKDMQTRLSAVRTVDDLRKLSVGVGLGWSSRKVLEAAGFSVETAPNQDLLIQMVMARRFDYFPRGVNEIFPEFDARTTAMPELAVERDLVLHFPLAAYVFVSPTAPRLARRISEGMEAMVRDGSLLRMVTAHHAEHLKRAGLCSRRILRISNPLLTPDTPLSRKALWCEPHAARVGWCAKGGSASSAAHRARSQTGSPSSRNEPRAPSAPVK